MNDDFTLPKKVLIPDTKPTNAPHEFHVETTFLYFGIPYLSDFVSLCTPYSVQMRENTDQKNSKY